MFNPKLSPPSATLWELFVPEETSKAVSEMYTWVNRKLCQFRNTLTSDDQAEVELLARNAERIAQAIESLYEKTDVSQTLEETIASLKYQLNAVVANIKQLTAAVSPQEISQKVAKLEKHISDFQGKKLPEQTASLQTREVPVREVKIEAPAAPPKKPGGTPPPPKQPMQTRNFGKIKEEYHKDVLAILSQIQEEKETQIQEEKKQKKIELAELVKRKAELEQKNPAAAELIEIKAKIRNLKNSEQPVETYLEEVQKAATEERQMIARGLFLEVFSTLNKKNFNQKELDGLKAVILKGEGEPRGQEAKALHTLFKDFIDNPKKFCDEKAATEVKKASAKQTTSSMTAEELKTLRSYLAAEGRSEKSIEKMCADETISKLEYLSLQKKVKEYLETVKTASPSSILKDPKLLLENFLKKIDSEAAKILLEMHPETSLENIKKEAGTYLKAKGVSQKEICIVANSPVNLLKTMQEVSFVRCVLFDKGESPSTLLSKSSFEKMKSEKQEELAIYLAKNRETTPEKVAPELENIDQLLSAYKQKRKDISFFVPPQNRQKKTPYSIREMTVNNALNNLGNKKFDDSIKIFLDETKVPSSHLLERMAMYLAKLVPEEPKSSNFMSQLSPIQSLWILERSSSGQTDQFIVDNMASRFFDNIEMTNPDSRQQSLQLFSYLQKHASDRSWGSKYLSLLNAIESDPRFAGVQNFL